MIILCFKMNICTLFLIVNDTTNCFKCISTLKFSSETKTLISETVRKRKSILYGLTFLSVVWKISTYCVRGLFFIFFSIATKFNQFYQVQEKIQHPLMFLKIVAFTQIFGRGFKTIPTCSCVCIAGVVVTD